MNGNLGYREEKENGGPLSFIPKNTLIAIVTGVFGILMAISAWWIFWQMGQSQEAIACAKDAQSRVAVIETKLEAQGKMLDTIKKQNDEMLMLIVRNAGNRR